MFAGSQLDMCVGLDIHMEMVPMPAPVPTPFPMPFVGQVEFSATGVLMGMGIGKAMSFITGAPPTGPVLVNGFHAVKTGDEAKNAETLPHIVIPPGTMWTPLPKPLKLKISPPPPAPDNPAAPPGDAIFITGSKTVNFEQSSACRLGTLAMSCSDPVRLPSSVLMSVPKGLPVLVGGPPTIDWMAAAKAFFLRNKWTAGLLHQLVSLLPPGRFQNLLEKGVCMLTGHPVDVGTGRLLTWAVDFVIQGPIKLPFERNYSSGWAERSSSLGNGWSHSFDERIWTERGRVVYLAGDGREIEFHTHELPGRAMREGQELFYAIDRLTLRCLGGGRWSIRSADGLVREFERHLESDASASRITRIRDTAGHWIRFVYGGGELARVETSEGKTVRLEHRDGHLVRISLPAAQVDGWYDQVRFEYSAAGDLIAAVDSAGNAKRYLYEEHLLIREIDRDGVTFWFEYDGRDSTSRCVRTWGTDNSTTSRLFFRDIVYDRPGLRTFVEDSLGNTTIYILNAANAVVGVIDPHGAETRYERDEALRIVTRRDPLGRTTHTSYDRRGNEIRRVSPDGTETESTYNEYDQRVRLVDPLGCEWLWTYDSRGRLATQWNSAGETLKYVYEGANISSIIRADGASWSYDFDAAGDLRRLRLPDGTAQERWYDRQGKLIKLRDAVGRVRNITYDNEGRPVFIADPGGLWSALSYSAEGDLTERRTNLRTIRYGYANYHRISSESIGTHVVRYHYSDEGLLSSVINEAGELHAFARDACGRTTEERPFDGSVVSYIRDQVGRIVIKRLPSQRSESYTYDERDRVSKINFSDGTASAFAFDPAGNLVEAINEAGRASWTRDIRGRPIHEAFEEDWIDSQLDVLGRRIELSSSRGLKQRVERTSTGDTSAVHVRQLASPTIWSATYQRDAIGREIRREVPGGSVSWTYDDIGLPREQVIEARSGGSARSSYVWSGGRQLANRVDQSAETRFFYDERGYLLSSLGASGSGRVRAVDQTGNLFGDADLSDRRYARGGRLLAMTQESSAYDADGNLVERRSGNGDVWRYQWDGAGRLAKVLSPGGSTVTFAYDALGRRRQSTVVELTSLNVPRERQTSWHWDNDVILHQVRTANGVAEEETWIFEPGTLSPIARLLGSDGGNTESIITDYLGAPRAALDDAGRIAWECQLDVYGVAHVRGAPASACPWRWPGQTADSDIGLSYNRHRYYDTTRGSYISKDPLQLIGGLRAYGYVPDPLTQADPFALSCSSDAQKLRDDMEANNRNAPDYPNAAHHIVMSNSPDMADARARLAALGIDKNSYLNGVYLPKTIADAEEAATSALPHSSLHTDAYKDYVNSRILACETRQQAVRALNDIRNSLLSGTF